MTGGGTPSPVIEYVLCKTWSRTSCFYRGQWRISPLLLLCNPMLTPVIRSEKKRSVAAFECLVSSSGMRASWTLSDYICHTYYSPVRPGQIGSVIEQGVRLDRYQCGSES